MSWPSSSGNSGKKLPLGNMWPRSETTGRSPSRHVLLSSANCLSGHQTCERSQIISCCGRQAQTRRRGARPGVQGCPGRHPLRAIHSASNLQNMLSRVRPIIPMHKSIRKREAADAVYTRAPGWQQLCGVDKTMANFHSKCTCPDGLCGACRTWLAAHAQRTRRPSSPILESRSRKLPDAVRKCSNR